MHAAEVLAIFYWPIVAACVLVFRRQWRKAGGNTKRQALLVGTAFATFVVFTILLYGFIGRRSALTLAVVYGFPVAGGTAILWLVWYCLSAAQSSRNWFAAAALAFFGLGFVGFGSWSIVGDFVLPRRHVEATVDKLEVGDTRSGLHYRVGLDGRRHNAVGEVYERLAVGDHIRAELGASTGTILRFERL